MTTKSIVIVALLAAGFGACNKSPAGAQPSADLSDEAMDRAQIPVKEDFEEQARTGITDDNLDDQVAELATQIQKDE